MRPKSAQAHELRHMKGDLVMERYLIKRMKAAAVPSTSRHAGLASHLASTLRECVFRRGQGQGLETCSRVCFRWAYGSGAGRSGPLGPLGYECAQHRQTRRPSVDGIRSKALRPFGLQ